MVLCCRDLEEALRLFTDRLGFRLDAIAPADGPTAALISGHGSQIALHTPDDAALSLLYGDVPPLPDPTPELAVSRETGATWQTGRAGMQYRDLIPDRMGGYLIASHIRIDEAGPVQDDVHFHDVRFQFIACVSGWVELVYEDQGGPFRLEAGACVVQPPGIRHRVLQASAGLEVVEVACPAIHATFIDHELALPTERVDPRDFEGQRFQHAREESSVDAGPVRACVGSTWPSSTDAHRFVFVAAGSLQLGDHALSRGDACLVPRSTELVASASDDARFFVVEMAED